MLYVYLTFDVFWTEKSQNIEFPDFPLFLIFALMEENSALWKIIPHSWKTAEKSCSRMHILYF